MKNYQRIFFIIFILFSICHFCNQNATAQKITNRGQLSTWTIFNSDKTIGNQFGLRYIPEFRVEKSIFETNFIDAQLSFNGYRIWQGTSFGDIHSEGEIKPYRIWTRYSSPQFELRIGLQKINFGSATLMRPLMWFDRIDPRDPLQITDGVYGALIRYYFLNNANVWLWGLYGNNNTKGLEIFETKENSIEFGGRLQHPLGNGEIAISFHHRKMDISSGFFDNAFFPNEIVPENRFAIDGKWDAGVGLWFETMLTHQKSDSIPYNYQQMFNVGTDYTFDFGQGLHTLGEHFVVNSSEKPFETGSKNQLSAILIDYPIGLLDQLFAIFYVDWDNENYYRFLRWQRTYDNWSFHVIGFWNPNQNMLYQLNTAHNYFAGKGIQLLVVFNH